MSKPRPGAPIPHGTNAGYTLHACRCERCREAKRDAARDYRARKRAGLIERPTSCAWCGGPLVQAKTGVPRVYCSMRCSAQARRPLCECGQRKDRAAAHCRQCTARAKERRTWDRIEAMWARGLTHRQIAAELGWTVEGTGAYISAARARGMNVPYRMPAQRVANIRAGNRRWREARLEAA